MKDYAKKSSQPKTQSESNGVGIMAIMVLSTVLFVGYSAYHFLHLHGDIKKNISTSAHTLTHHIKKHLVLHAKAKPIEKKEMPSEKAKPKSVLKKTPEKEKALTASNPVDIQPRYDFYRLLPAMKVNIPAASQH